MAEKWIQTDDQTSIVREENLQLKKQVAELQEENFSLKVRNEQNLCKMDRCNVSSFKELYRIP